MEKQVIHHVSQEGRKHIIVLLILSMIVICAMTSSVVTATKPIEIMLSFPFSNIIFAIFTFPIIDAVCELYGKKQAYLVSIIGIISQLIFVIIVELSILAPAAPEWTMQNIYASVLSKSDLVVVGTIVGFLISQFIDIYIFQKIRKYSNGRHLWLRSGISSIAGQLIDSIIFISIVFGSYPNKEELIFGSFVSKALFCLLAIPITYIIVYVTRIYLASGRKN